MHAVFMFTHIYACIALCIYNAYRCDQYRWAHQGTRSFYFGKLEIKRKTSAIDANDGGKHRGDNRFKRLEYWGIQSSYLIHYIGDHEIYKPFSHRNCKKSCKPFVRSAPHVKEKVTTCSCSLYVTIIIFIT